MPFYEENKKFADEVSLLLVSCFPFETRKTCFQFITKVLLPDEDMLSQDDGIRTHYFVSLLKGVSCWPC